MEVSDRSTLRNGCFTQGKEHLVQNNYESGYPTQHSGDGNEENELLSLPGIESQSFN
jgi:hypothetical protein